MTEQSYPCPSCGFLVFDELPGTYAICDVCGWEDDPAQLRHPSMAGGANKLSLFAHQLETLSKVPIGVTSFRGFERASTWRPLLPNEVQSASVPNDGLSYFEAAADEALSYYWLKEAK